MPLVLNWASLLLDHCYIKLRASLVVKWSRIHLYCRSSVPGSRRSPAEGNGHPLWYSCLGNPMDKEAWWATVHGSCKELNMTERLVRHTHTQTYMYTELQNKLKALGRPNPFLWGHSGLHGIFYSTGSLIRKVCHSRSLPLLMGAMHN